MKTTNSRLIAELLEILDETTETVKRLKDVGMDGLNHQAAPDRWSALQCIEHLNLYGDFYLPEIEQKLLKQHPLPGDPVVKSGMLGNYFAGLMKVSDGKIKKMKAPKDKSPLASSLSITTLERFLKQQDRLRSLLMQSQSIDLTKTRVAISISRFITLRLGDTFRFLIYHIERHVIQAERAVV